jgi:hypothetical protein
VSKEDKKAYLKLFKEYQDVFAWSYQELKTYDTHIIQHTIPLKYGIKPFQQNLRKYHPSLEPLMYQELKKLLDAKIIFQVRHFAWVANLVHVRKKSGEIHLCVDFRNLNRASKKDNYPVPPMEQLLQIVSSSEIFSLLDGFSRYNQVLVSEDDRLKTTFRTKWGTFSYKHMPFGLINAGETFQRAMDVAFRGLINKCVVVYLDDVIVYSKNKEDHIQDLTQIFERCRKYGIYLNPKKTIFGVEEGKLLGHIISQEGININPEWIKAIAQLPLPHNKKTMQSFFRKINFVRKFTPDFTETVKPLQKMILKYAKFKWDEERRGDFNNIKTAISQAPVLRSPDFSKYFFFIPLLLTNPWLQYLPKRMMRTMKHHILYEHQPPRS